MEVLGWLLALGGWRARGPRDTADRVGPPDGVEWPVVVAEVGGETVFSVATGRGGLGLRRIGAEEHEGLRTGDLDFDEHTRVSVQDGRYHELHAGLREAYRRADEIGRAEVREDGVVCYAEPGVGRPEAVLQAARLRVRALADQRAYDPGVEGFLERSDEAPGLLVAVIDRLAAADPGRAARLAAPLEDHRHLDVALAAAAACGVDALLARVPLDPTGVFDRLPVDRLPDALDRLGRLDRVAPDVLAFAARRLADQPTLGARPLLRRLIEASLEDDVRRPCLEALGAVGRIDDVPWLRDLPPGASVDRVVARIQDRSGAEGGELGLAQRIAGGDLSLSDPPPTSGGKR